MKRAEDEAHFFFRLCSDHLSIEAIPKRRLDLDLDRMRVHVENELLMSTPSFVVFRRKNGEEVTLRKDGRMLIRNVSSEEIARRVAANVLGLFSGIEADGSSLDCDEPGAGGCPLGHLIYVQSCFYRD